MFGVVHACRQTLDDELLEQWRAHLCGLCLSLRDSRGQLSRALTNTDAVMLSVLVEAQQSGTADRTLAGPCPLRGMRTAQVVPADAVAARLGATASVTLAAAKAGDVRAERVHHLTAPTVKSRAVAAMAGPLRRSALLDTEMADAVRATELLDDLAGQAALESAIRIGDPLLAVTAPTARAAGRIFASSAVLTGRLENEEPLRAIGEAFGALAHLLDAAQDLAADRRSGAFNPIQATGGSLADARRLAGQLVRRIRTRFDTLQLDDGRLARALLVNGTHAAVHSTFAGGRLLLDGRHPGRRTWGTRGRRRDRRRRRPQAHQTARTSTRPFPRQHRKSRPSRRSGRPCCPGSASTAPATPAAPLTRTPAPAGSTTPAAVAVTDHAASAGTVAIVTAAAATATEPHLRNGGVVRQQADIARSGTVGGRVHDAGMNTFTIAPSGPYSLRESAEFGFGGRAADRYDAVMRLAFCRDDYSGQVGVELRQDATGVHGIVHHGGSADLVAVKAQVARVLSLDHDAEGFVDIGRRDPVIGRLQDAAPGLRPVLFYSPYEAAVWSVISARRPAAQMAQVRQRLAEAHGAVFRLAGRELAAVPTPAQLLQVKEFPGLDRRKD